MKNVKNQVLKEIETQGIKPTSRFYFVSRNYFFGLLFLVSVVVGAISFSAILNQLILGSRLAEGVQPFMTPTLFFISIPLFWLFILICFTASAWYNFKRTDGAHRKENAIIVLASILFSLLFGLLLFRVGLAENIDHVMKSFFPTYRINTEQRLERTALYLEKNDQEEKAKAALLERERLRTVCFNQGREDCLEDSFEVKENQ